LAGSNVVRANPSWRSLFSDNAVADGVTHNNGVARNNWRGLRREWYEIDEVSFSSRCTWQPVQKVDATAVAEVFDRKACVGVNGDQIAVTGAPDHASVVAVFPIGDSSVSPRLRRWSASFVASWIVRPKGSSGACINGSCLVKRSAYIENPVNHKWRSDECSY
jgi:hypothetical protein